MKYYQQGDVLLKCIDKLPEGLCKLPGKAVQEGEVTGHVHQFREGEVEVYTDSQNPEEAVFNELNKWIVVREGGAPLTHEEHGTIEVPPGIYKIDLVREYDYERDEERRVVD